MCVIIEVRADVLVCSQPLGPALARAKLFESQGYKPVLVTFSEWATRKISSTVS